MKNKTVGRREVTPTLQKEKTLSAEHGQSYTPNSMTNKRRNMP
jgi:hypothetical protein